MRRACRLLSVLGIALLAAAACTSRPALRTVAPPTPEPVSGDALSPVPREQPWIFSSGQPRPQDLKRFAIRPASERLLRVVPRLEGLHEAPLKTTERTAGLFLLEVQSTELPGALLQRAQGPIFRAFADDRSFGDWLILVTDVLVRAPPDPIPPTAYRWTRAQVEEFARCGIPMEGSNDCSRTFFERAQVVVLKGAAGPPVGL
jgi:hypothetical protein